MQDMLDLASPVALVYHDSNGTNGIGAEDGGYRVGAALEEDCDTIAGRDLVGRISGRKSLRFETELMKAYDGAAVGDRGAIALALGSIPEESGEVSMIIRHESKICP